MIVINSKLKRKKKKTIKIDWIDKVVVDRWFFCLFKLAFSQSIYIPSFNFVRYLVVAISKIEKQFKKHQSLKNIRLCSINVEKHGTFYRF